MSPARLCGSEVTGFQMVSCLLCVVGFPAFSTSPLERVAVCLPLALATC